MIRRKLLQVSAVFMATLGAGLLANLLQAATADDIKVSELKPGVYLFQSAGSNVVAMTGKDGALVIDGGLPEHSEALYKAIQQATGSKRINTLFNTHWHPEQLGLNQHASRDGATIIAHEQTLMFLKHKVSSPLVKGSFGPVPEKERPSKTFKTEGSLEFDGHKIEYGYLPAAHTNGDLYVYFRDLNLLVAGGAVGSDSWPLVDFRNGAFIGGVVRAHVKLAALVQADTMVIPATGRPMSGADIVTQREMYEKLFVDLNALMNKGMGFNDIVATNPLKGFESRYGDPSVFLDGIYRSMEMAYVPD